MRGAPKGAPLVSDEEAIKAVRQFFAVHHHGVCPQRPAVAAGGPFRYELFAWWLGWWHRARETSEQYGEEGNWERFVAGQLEQMIGEHNADCREHWHASLMIRLVKGQYLRHDDPALEETADPAWEYIEWNAMRKRLGTYPPGRPGGRSNEYRDMLIGEAISALHRVRFEAWEPTSHATGVGWGIPVVAKAFELESKLKLESSHLRRVWATHHKQHGYIIRWFKHDYWPKEVRDRLGLNEKLWPMDCESVLVEVP